MKNPYSELLNLMREQGAKYNPPTIEIGEVISPNPVKIKLGDLQLDKDDVLINDFLLQGYKRQLKVNGITNEYETTDTLKKGDLLAIMPAGDRQRFIVLCKVVSL